MDTAGLEVVLGIDAGGTETRSRAVAGGRVLHEATGGPGNPGGLDTGTLMDRYRPVLEGCPEPTVVGACIAGTGHPSARERMTRLLRDWWPRALVEVVPDYVAAYHAAPPGTDVCVIAGTGSLVCSRIEDTYAVGGGRGWIIGDHGSGARLGRAALDHYCENPSAAPSRVQTMIDASLGTSDWREIVAALHKHSSPAAVLAAAAPVLTAEAARGSRWAVESLAAEMDQLASTTTHHLQQHLPGLRSVQVALSGGVWTSSHAVAAFTEVLTRRSDRPVHVTRSTDSALDGAVRFAESLQT